MANASMDFITLVASLGSFDRILLWVICPNSRTSDQGVFRPPFYLLVRLFRRFHSRGRKAAPAPITIYTLPTYRSIKAIP